MNLVAAFEKCLKGSEHTKLYSEPTKTPESASSSEASNSWGVNFPSRPSAPPWVPAEVCGPLPREIKQSSQPRGDETESHAAASASVQEGQPLHIAEATARSPGTSTTHSPRSLPFDSNEDRSSPWPAPIISQYL